VNLFKLFDYSVPLVAAATLLGVAAIITVSIASSTAYDIKRSQDVVEVTGSAKLAVESDTARWIIRLATDTGVNDQQAGFDRLQAATVQITDYLTAQGLTDYETPTISSNEQYIYPQNSQPLFTGYNVQRQIIVRSSEVAKVNELANNMVPLSGNNYTVSTGMVELTYSKLDEARVSLLSEAIKDATARAEAIAKESSRTIGELREASSGVVQVLPKDGIEISDYGAYDTQSMQKEVMVTVRATFEL